MEIIVKKMDYKDKDIQDIIDTYIYNEQIENYELYDSNTNKEIKDYDLKVFIYEGIYFPAKLKKRKYKNEDFIEVYLVDYHKNNYKIGCIPKELTHIIWKDIDENKEIPVKIVGGKYKEYDILENKIKIEEEPYEIKIEYITDEEKLVIENKRKQDEKIRQIKKEKQIKDITIETIICFLFGLLGGHKFYKGKIKEGMLYLFTGGIFGIGWMLDIIKLLIKLKDIKAL